MNRLVSLTSRSILFQMPEARLFAEDRAIAFLLRGHGLHRGIGGYSACDRRQQHQTQQYAAQKFRISLDCRIHN